MILRTATRDFLRFDFLKWCIIHYNVQYVSTSQYKPSFFLTLLH